MAPKKKAAKKAAAKKAAAKKAPAKSLPKPGDKNAVPPVFRLDQGESLPSEPAK